MAKLPVIKLPENKESGQLEVADRIFMLPLRKDLLNEYVIMQRRALRQGTHSTKTRAEVSGTNKKPFKQKGTGNARQGTLKGPHQYGGGVAFGPKPRDYGMKLNRKQKKETLRIALSQRRFDGSFGVIENFEVASGKTKDALALLKAFESKKILLIGDLSDVTRRSLQNIKEVRVIPAVAVNVKDLLYADHVLATKEAVQSIDRFLQADLEEKAA
jgi:large subunit ribosomal protein L4